MNQVNSVNHESASKLFTRGGQIAFHNLRMFFQINKAVWKSVFLVMLITIGVLTYVLTPGEILETALAYQKASVLSWFDNYYTVSLPVNGKVVSFNSKALLEHPYFLNKAGLLWGSIYQAFWWAVGITIAASIALAYFFVVKGKKQGESQFIRGAELVEARVLTKQVLKKEQNSDIVIDEVPILKDSEVQHFLVHGTIGTGKSQLMMKFIEQIRQRGDRVIIYDKGCSFTSHFFDESQDVILNPFDSRCANWDMWGEAPRDTDFANMAESLIPLHGQTDPFWVDAARTVFASVAVKLRDEENPTIDKLLSILLTSEFESLEPFLKGTPAATLVSGKIEKTAISIRSVITTYLKSLQSLRGLNEDSREKFTIRDYILNDDNKGWLFISSNGEQHSSLKPLISMWLAMASITLLSLKEDRNRRIWFICDELPSLHRLPMLAETIAEVRKFGGCFMLGMQSFSQLGKVYGRDTASEIFDLLNTRFYFRSPSSEMARLVATELGEAEIEEATESYSYGANTIRDGISVGKHKTKRQIVTYPEVMAMQNMECFLRLPGNYPVAKMKLTYEPRRTVASDFVERELPKVTTTDTNANVEETTSHGTERDNKKIRMVQKHDTLAQESKSNTRLTKGQQAADQSDCLEEPDEMAY